jgi:hypothetical protein
LTGFSALTGLADFAFAAGAEAFGGAGFDGGGGVGLCIALGAADFATLVCEVAGVLLLIGLA